MLLSKKPNVTLSEYKLFTIRCKTVFILPSEIKKDTMYYRSYLIKDHNSNMRMLNKDLEDKEKKIHDREK